MKKFCLSMILAIFMMPLFAVPSKADAYRGGWRDRFYFGGGYAPYYPYGPVAYGYPVVPIVPYAVAPVAVGAPPTFVGPPLNIAYYCPDPSGYYPYVPSCFRHWRAILVQ